MSEIERAARHESLAAALAGIPIRFWACPVPGHSDRRGPDGELVGTVEWVDGVALCTAPGCGRASNDPPGDEWCNCEIYGCTGQCCGVGRCAHTPESTGGDRG